MTDRVRRTSAEGAEGSQGQGGQFVYLLYSHSGDSGYDSLSMNGIVASEAEADAWCLAVSNGVRWWEMFEVGQPEQGRLDQSEEVHA